MKTIDLTRILGETKSKKFFLQIIYLQFLLLTSCSSPHVDIAIKNLTTDKVENIRISPTGRENKELLQFMANKTIHYRLDMSNLPPHDGSYAISYMRSGKKESHIFGYYTNGYPLAEKYFISIVKDSLIVKEF